MIRRRFSLIPLYSFCAFTDIAHEFLMRLGIRFLMFDLDNTIAAYRENEPPEQILQWFHEARKHGITPYLVSNSSRIERVKTFSELLGSDYVLKARKPSPEKLLLAMESAGFDASQSAFIGDQIITDTLAANRAGVVSIIVRPVRFSNPLFTIRYLLELPFRIICKIRQGIRGNKFENKFSN